MAAVQGGMVLQPDMESGPQQNTVEEEPRIYPYDSGLPFIIMVFLSVALSISDGITAMGLEIPFLSSFSTFLIWLAFFAFMLLVLTVTYILIPNAKVRFLPALSAAVISSIAFTAVQYLYLETQMFVSRMNAVYGVFAAIPLFMVWLNIGWFIVLLGSELSYVFQNVDNYPLEDMS